MKLKLKDLNEEEGKDDKKYEWVEKVCICIVGRTKKSVTPKLGFQINQSFLSSDGLEKMKKLTIGKIIIVSEKVLDPPSRRQDAMTKILNSH